MGWSEEQKTWKPGRAGRDLESSSRRKSGAVVGKHLGAFSTEWSSQYSRRMVPFLNNDNISSICTVVKVPQKSLICLQRLGYIQSYAAMSSKSCLSPSWTTGESQKSSLCLWSGVVRSLRAITSSALPLSPKTAEYRPSIVDLLQPLRISCFLDLRLPPKNHLPRLSSRLLPLHSPHPSSP